MILDSSGNIRSHVVDAKSRIMVLGGMDISTSPQSHKSKDFLFPGRWTFQFTSSLRILVFLWSFWHSPFFTWSFKMDRQTPQTKNKNKSDLFPDGAPWNRCGVFNRRSKLRTLFGNPQWEVSSARRLPGRLLLENLANWSDIMDSKTAPTGLL